MKSKCCKAETTKTYRPYSGKPPYYLCENCLNVCDVIESKPQSRCISCGRFSKHMQCSKCEGINEIENEILKYSYTKSPEQSKSNQQIYTEMVEWLWSSDDQYETGKEYREALLAKLKELLQI